MVVEVTAWNVTEAYIEMLARMRVCGKPEPSRAGPVLSIPDPVVLNICRPRQRILFDEVRDANPFFHMMEFIWMMAGRNDVAWIQQFNSNFGQYANNGVVHGAYGHRWRTHFSVDQITAVVELLRRDPNTRRAVLGMWDAFVDLTPGYNDYPCNTHIYFRNRDGELDMTVCNRSNDLIWGMLGANAVHMTLLHELIAHFSGLKLGRYRVFTNNCHFYINMPKAKEILATTVSEDYYDNGQCKETNTFVEDPEDLEVFLEDCGHFVDGRYLKMQDGWLTDTAYPAYNFYHSRDPEILDTIAAPDWRLACQKWATRRG
jgi:thymidylate synthase